MNYDIPSFQIRTHNIPRFQNQIDASSYTPSILHSAAWCSIDNIHFPRCSPSLSFRDHQAALHKYPNASIASYNNTRRLSRNTIHCHLNLTSVQSSEVHKRPHRSSSFNVPTRRTSVWTLED